MASPQTLSEEQRQQIIAKLLAERRNKAQGSSSAVKCVEDEVDRTQRVQQLIRQRAAARQMSGAGLLPGQHQQPPQLGRHTANAQLQQEESLDDLLSPGSTCSLMSTKQRPHRSPAGIAQHLHLRDMGSPKQLTARGDVGPALELDERHYPASAAAAVASKQQHQLEDVLEGPVDVSQLWAGRTSPSEQHSYDTLGAEDDATCCSSSPSYMDASLTFRQSGRQQQWRPIQQQQQQQDRASLQQPQQQQLLQQPQQRVPPQQQRRQVQQHQQHQQQARKQQQPRQQQQQQQHRLASPARQHPLPDTYPASRDARIQQLAQPKSANRQKYEQMKLEAELELLQSCSFTPKTGRAPQHRTGHEGLPVSERLYHTAAERQAKLQRKAAEQQASHIQGCTFKPQTNSAAHARYLAAYEYVPIHERLGEVLRSKNEKLVQIQMRVEQEACDVATFTPRINPRSSMLALRRSRQGGCSPGGGDGASSSPLDQQQRGLDQSLGLRDSSRGRGVRKSRSEADLAARHCSFTPRINASSKALLQASGEIPAGFLQRQQYFDRLAREKKQLLALAVEDQHCIFSPTRPASEFGRSSSSIDESYLERIERLAYQDKRNMEAARTALAEQVHGSECTFAPAINPRSQRMVKATPLQELYENSRGKMKRGAAALAVEVQRLQECTFSPNLAKPGVCQSSPAEAKLSLSASEVDAVVHRLHSAQRQKEDKVEQAMSFKQYQELKQCTFTPEITRAVPQQQGPVLVRGLGRFMELKDMARRQQEHKSQVEAKVFMTQLKPGPPTFTVPQPFNLGRGGAATQQQLRRSQAEALALEAAARECTFKPHINSSHKSRQQRVQQLLEGHRE